MNINSVSIFLLFGTFMFSACNVSINTMPLVGSRFNAHPYSVVIQSDGKIVLAGWMETASGDVIRIVRYKIDGLLDTSFNATGKVTTTIGLSTRGESAAIQSDGKIVVAGYSETATGSVFAVLRYGIDGTLDASFNNSGIVTTAIGTFSYANSAAIQSDGKIVVAGHSNSGSGYVFTILRYNTNGSLDTSFNSTGIVTTAMDSGFDAFAHSVTIQTDGKIVAAGHSDTGSGNVFMIARYNTDGSLDTSFNTSGTATTSIGLSSRANSVAIQTDGKIVVAGYSETSTSYIISVARYNVDGSLDASFNTTGIVTTAIGTYSCANSVAIQSDGRIVVATPINDGTAYVIAVVRYNVNGLLDTSFNITGKVTTANLRNNQTH